jgi:alpha-beta hydrolase superfamily lysophospholipase
MIKSTTGDVVKTREWRVPEPNAQIFLVHGYAEHVGRYEHFASQLNNAGFDVIGYDQVGYGLSNGERAYVSRFDQYVWDLHSVMRHYKNEAIPNFLFGHSMGGLVATSYCILYRPKLNGVITSGAALKVNKDTSPILQKIAPVLGEIFPRLKTTKIGSQDISRDPLVVEAYEKDPLVYHEGIKARLAGEMLGRIKRTNQLAHLFTQPVLMMHGGADQLTDPNGTMQFFNSCASVEKELKIWDGLLHEILNEPEKESVITHLVNWINRRIQLSEDV